MSGYFRRIIAHRILRTLSKHRKLADDEVELLERNVARLVKTQDVRKKTREGDAQFKVDLQQLKKTVQETNPLDVTTVMPQITGDVIEGCQQEKNDITVSVNCQTFYQHILDCVQQQGTAFGSSEDIGGNETPSQTVVVEYSSPNIAKPFHAGHLRSTIIGNFIANLYQHVGHTVHRINFLGDWGTQFGLLALGFQRYGDEELLREDPLLQLFKIYVQINQDVEQEKKVKHNSTYTEGLQLFSQLELGEMDLVRLWRRFTQLSLKEYSKMYERLGVSFTETQFESDFSDRAQQLITSLRHKGWFQLDEQGVGYVTVQDRGSDIQATLVKSDGSSLYLARDVAAALHRHEQLRPDRVHYVVEAGQQLHFRQLVGVLRRLSIPWADRDVEDVHIKFGRVEGMSSRRGTVVFLRDILDEARDRLIQSLREKKTTRVQDVDQVADRLAVSAVIVQDLKGRRQNNYTFSWDRMLSFSADSGVFLQYAHARLCSLLTACGAEKANKIDVTCLRGDTCHHLIMFIARYPEVVQGAMASLEPCNIVQYLLRLSHLVNAAYSTLPVKGEPAEVAQARLAVFDCARQVLSNGMELVGVQPLHQM